MRFTDITFKTAEMGAIKHFYKDVLGVLRSSHKGAASSRLASAKRS